MTNEVDLRFAFFEWLSWRDIADKRYVEFQSAQARRGEWIDGVLQAAGLGPEDEGEWNIVYKGMRYNFWRHQSGKGVEIVPIFEPNYSFIVDPEDEEDEH